MKEYQEIILNREFEEESRREKLCQEYEARLRNNSKKYHNYDIREWAGL